VWHYFFLLYYYFFIYIPVQANEPELLRASVDGVGWRVSGRGKADRGGKDKEGQRRSKWAKGLN